MKHDLLMCLALLGSRQPLSKMQKSRNSGLLRLEYEREVRGYLKHLIDRMPKDKLSCYEAGCQRLTVGEHLTAALLLLVGRSPWINLYLSFEGKEIWGRYLGLCKTDSIGLVQSTKQHGGMQSLQSFFKMI